MIIPFVKKIIELQKFLSRKFDQILPKKMVIFANDIFDHDILPRYLKKDMVVCDIGGGKLPNITLDQKKSLNLKVIGVDISGEELGKAPAGIYDETIAADITRYDNSGKQGDIILCRALLEHVPNVYDGLRNIAEMTKTDGHILIFVPCKNAWYSRLNMVLPEKFKKNLLQFFFPQKSHRLGFKAYYDFCTPGEFKEIFSDLGLQIKEEYICYNSQYFSILTPVHIIWRLYQLVVYFLKADNFCEAYVFVVQKTE